MTFDMNTAYAAFQLVCHCWPFLLILILIVIIAMLCTAGEKKSTSKGSGLVYRSGNAMCDYGVPFEKPLPELYKLRRDLDSIKK